MILGQTTLDTVQYRLPKGIILVDDANLANAEFLPNTVDLRARFIEVGRPDIDHIVLQGLIQELRTCKETDQRKLTGFRQGDIPSAGWCSDEEPGCKDVSVEQLLEASRRFL